MDGPATAADSPPRSAGVVASSLSALARWGGVLVAPRTTVAALPEQEGQRDGLWLGLLYVVGTSLYQLAEGVATLYAVRNYSGLLAVASILGRALLAPILTLVVAETILGKERSHRRGLSLVPLVVVGSVVHMARQMGHSLPLSELGAAVAGAVLGVGLVAWIRPVVPPEQRGDA
jgi:hypothetical protein